MRRCYRRRSTGQLLKSDLSCVPHRKFAVVTPRSTLFFYLFVSLKVVTSSTPHIAHRATYRDKTVWPITMVTGLHSYHAYVITYLGFLSLAKLLWVFRKGMIHTFSITTILPAVPSRCCHPPRLPELVKIHPRTQTPICTSLSTMMYILAPRTPRSILSYSFHFQHGTPRFFFLSFDSSLHHQQAANPQLPSLRPLGLPGSLRTEPHPTLSRVSGPTGVI